MWMRRVRWKRWRRGNEGVWRCSDGPRCSRVRRTSANTYLDPFPCSSFPVLWLWPFFKAESRLYLYQRSTLVLLWACSQAPRIPTPPPSSPYSPLGPFTLSSTTRIGVEHRANGGDSISSPRYKRSGTGLGDDGGCGRRCGCGQEDEDMT